MLKKIGFKVELRAGCNVILCLLSHLLLNFAKGCIVLQFLFGSWVFGEFRIGIQAVHYGFFYKLLKTSEKSQSLWSDFLLEQGNCLFDICVQRSCICGALLFLNARNG